MTIISLTTVKANLGIATATTTYDASITAQIPIIDAKVKRICRNNFNNQIILSTTSGSPYVEISGVYYWWGGSKSRVDRPSPMLQEIVQDIPVGTLVSGETIPDSSILEVYYDYSAEFSGVTYSAPFIKLADNATSTDTGAQGFYGWNVAYDSVVSKGLWWLISEQSTTIRDDTWQSKSVGPLSVTKSSGADVRIDQKSGMPLWFTKALPRYM